MAILRNPFDRLLSEGKHTGFKCLAELPPKPSAMEEVGQKAASLVDSAKSWFYNSSQTAEKGPAAAETKGAGASTSTSSASSSVYSSGGATQKYMKDANGNIVKKPKVEGATTFAEYVKCGESNVMVKRICGCLDYPKAQSCGDYSEGSAIDAHFRHHSMTRAHLECAKKVGKLHVVSVLGPPPSHHRVVPSHRPNNSPSHTPPSHTHTHTTIDP